MNIVACCVDLWESRLYGYGWPTVDYFHTTCIIVIVRVNILALRKESEPNGNLTFPVQRSCYLRINSDVTTLYRT